MVTKTGTEGSDSLSVDGTFDAPIDTLLLGLGGDDSLTGGFGANTLVGGDGDDQFFFRHGADGFVDGNFVFVEDTRPDSFEGGNGTDTLWMFTTLAERTAFGDNVGFRVNLLSGTDDRGNSFTGIENMFGSQGDDTLGGDDGANFITGNAGNDRLSGRGGDDTLFGDEGDDTLTGGPGNDFLHGGSGSDELLGGAGNDTLQGSWSGLAPDLDTRADTLRGGGGDDRISSFSGHGEIDGGTGDDAIVVAIPVAFAGPITLTIDGGAGFDTLQFGAVGAVGLDRIDWTAGILHTDDGRQVSFSGIERINGQDKPDPCERGTAGADRFIATAAANCFDGLAGRDTVIYRDSDAGVQVDLRSGTGTGGFAEGDQLTSIESLLGSRFDDVLQGSAARNALDGLQGNDALFGRAGNDTLRGGGGDDALDGGAGIDALQGGAGNDLLFGGAGGDILRGDAGKDEMRGGDGNDEVWGGDGADKLYGDAGNDELWGDAGNDILRGGDGNDTLHGGNGDDTLIFSAPGDRFFGGNGSDEVSFARLSLDAGGIDLLGSDPGNWTEHRLSAETVLSGIEHILGSLSNDRIFGTTGNDTIFGNAGNDKIYGGGGVDSLNGGGGDDRFWLGRGSLELVTGGAGADRFILNSANASIPGATPHPAERPSDVVIEDFTLPTPGVGQVEDRLILRGFGAGFDEAALFAAVTQEGADVLFRLPDDLSLLLANVDLTDFMAVATTLPGLVDFI